MPSLLPQSQTKYVPLLPFYSPPQTTPTEAAMALEGASEELTSLTATFSKGGFINLLSCDNANRPPWLSKALQKVSDCTLFEWDLESTLQQIPTGLDWIGKIEPLLP